MFSRFVSRLVSLFSVSNIIDVLWPNPEFWYVNTPGVADDGVGDLTSQELLDIADRIELLSDWFDYVDCSDVAWSADDIREVADDIWLHNPALLDEDADGRR